MAPGNSRGQVAIVAKFLGCLYVFGVLKLFGPAPRHRRRRPRRLHRVGHLK